MKLITILATTAITILIIYSCKKTDDTTNKRPIADFTFTIKNQGMVPDTVNFSSTTTNATSLSWNFDNGTTSTLNSPQFVYTNAGTYNVKLVASNQYGTDSISKQVTITLNKPNANFTLNIHNQGFLPDTVDFLSSTTNATSLKWFFGDGKMDTAINPHHVFTSQGTFNVKLVASNAAGSDSITKPVILILNKPIASFTFTTSNLELLPVIMTANNTTIGSNVSYLWSFGNSSSNQVNPTNNFTAGGIYNIKLIATNASGSDSMSKEIRISPYPQVYKNFNGAQLNLFAWGGNHVMLLSRSSNLNRVAMFKWLKAMDTTYGYYKLCTGRDPYINSPTYINNRTTIADVPSTCGAGCGYLGFTGIEMQNDYFDIEYNAISQHNQFDQVPFYEFGRNFWFYGSQLAYKANDPTTTGFAIYMRFTSMSAAGINGAPFGSLSFNDFKNSIMQLVDKYLADPSLNWANTLGVGKGVPNNWGASDLFASFCMRLQRDYGGEIFVQNLWKEAGKRPAANTTQDAVDNFFLASCAAAKKNLTVLFQSWRWSLSSSAIAEANKYP